MNAWRIVESTVPARVLTALLAGALCVALAQAAPAAASPESVEAWGSNGSGQVGDGATTDALTPVTVGGLNNPIAVAAGGAHSLALLQNGTVMDWGDDSVGELGDGGTAPSCPSAPFGEPCRDAPVQVSGLSGATAVAGGGDQSTGFSLALLQNGTVVGWGDNVDGQLAQGSGGVSSYDTPVAIDGLSNVVAIAAGSNHALALLSNGTVMAWGDNNVGQLGDGTQTGPTTCGNASNYCSKTPVTVMRTSDLPLTGVTAIAAGDGFSLALLQNGTVDVWGTDGNGELANGTVGGSSDRPIPVNGLGGVTALAAGSRSDHALALLSGGTLDGWGDNAGAQLDNAPCSECLSPTQLPDVGGVTAIAGGTFHSVALLSNGQVLAWGEPPLGDGTSNESFKPVQVSGLTGATAVAAGDSFGLALVRNFVPGPVPIPFPNIHIHCLVPCTAIKLVVTVPGPGIVTAQQAVTISHAPRRRTRHHKARLLVKATSVTARHAGTVTLKLRLTAAGRKALERRRRLRVRILLTYSPTVGAPTSRTITVTFKLGHHRRHR